jgi:RNA polymerase sigma factor (sigma-70 family)
MSRQPPSDDDESLVRRCLDGDGSAWGVLVLRYQRLVYAIARRGGFDEDDAADVLQTVFLKLIQSLPRLSAPSRLQAWIVTTSKREVINRRRKAEPTVPLDARTGADMGSGDDPEALQVADEADGPEASVEHWQRVMRVRRALETLDGPCRRLLLALFGGESPGYEDVARLLDMPIGSIGPTRARCLDKLRRLLEGNA